MGTSGFLAGAAGLYVITILLLQWLLRFLVRSHRVQLDYLHSEIDRLDVRLQKEIERCDRLENKVQILQQQLAEISERK